MMKKITTIILLLFIQYSLAQQAQEAPFKDHIPKMMTVPNAVDSNQDGELSSKEILAAPQQLRKLDKNGDGHLDHDEIGAYMDVLPLVRNHFITHVIDDDGDVQISAEEIAHATTSLKYLDRNDDWHISKVEIAYPKNPNAPHFHLRNYPPDTWKLFRGYTREMSGPILPGEDDRAYKGYMLVHDNGDNMQVQRTKGIYLLDGKGKKVHEWPVEGYSPEATTSYLLPDGRLLRTLSTHHWTKDEDFPVGAHSSIQLQAWDGTILWEYSMSVAEKYSFHHDVEYLPNGNILAIRYTAFTPEEAAAMGWDPAQGQGIVNRIKREGAGLVWMDSILELKPDLEDGSTEIVWQWNTWDHYVQDNYPDKPNYGDVRNPQKIHVNYLNLARDVPFNSGQFHHINSIDYNAELDMILLSSPTYGEIWIIDHSTTMEEAASERGGQHNKGGDLLYRWGNDEAFGADIRDNSTLYWQHNAHWIDNGLPGAGNILIFNNGTRRTLDNTYLKEPPTGGGIGREYSNLLEVKLPVNRGGGFNNRGEAEIVWSWEHPDRLDYYAPFMSGLQRQANGNTLFVNAYNKTIIEVTPEGKEVLHFRTAGWGRLHRIQKYAPDYSGLKFE